MNLSDDDLKPIISEGELRLITMMQRGGASGGLGYQYEDYFAVSILISGIREAIAGSGAPLAVTRQGRAAVDDVIVRKGEDFKFFQLKTSPTVTWGADDGRLVTQFVLQQKICTALAMSFQLGLVNASHDRVRLLRDGRPSELANVEVIHFPNLIRRPEFWSASGPGYADLKEVIPASIVTPSNLEVVAQKIFDCWYDFRDSEGYVCAATAYQQLLALEEVPIATDNLAMSSDDRAETNRLIGLGITVAVDRGFCHWTCGFQSGQIGRYGMSTATRFFLRLASRRPVNDDEFLELVP